jgi:flagellar biosynthesis protein FliQ
MAPIEAVTLGQNAILLTLMLAGPLLLVGMVIGILIALFQAVTQIQEMTLTFVPKIVGVMLALVFFSSWMMIKLTEYTRELIVSLPEIIR